ncbi:DNA mismatch repair protein MutS [Nocardia sp. BSTN01]|uniref:MutS-related protein n=1 Tax=Nocardia sp. BSTN01 TaxID=2783665 RepID=UPI00188EB1AB|nr:DNA mismatch repair protein MutS [Nocardia sp. BSTN01]MBF5001121.1 DNA mismatch repair protein MutS [Nocardia sp. BSTN01]
MQTVSVLWPVPAERVASVEVGEDALTDLEIAPLLAAIVGDTDDHDLIALLRRPVRDPDTVRFRQEVFTDLDNPETHSAAEDFVIAMWRVRRRLRVAGELYHPHQRHRLHLDAAADYVTAVTALHTTAARLSLRSRALLRWRTYLDTYCASTDLRALADDIDTVQAALAQVRYRLRILGRTLEVSAAHPAPDYTAAVTHLLARFGAPQRHHSRPRPEWPDMNQTEEQILDRVAARHPAPFARLAEFATRHRDVIAPEVADFDRGMQFYLRYRRFVHRAAGTGRSVCLPEIAAPGDPIHADRAYDLALATRSPNPVVCNDFRLQDPERVAVVTGPNQGGKTTFARTIGQLVYFAALGGPVPAHTARLPLPDRIHTHFERAEHAGDPDGRLLADLRSMREILRTASADTLIVLNESFSTTTTHDGVRIAGEVLARIVRRGAWGVWVSFFDDLAAAGPEVVSMVALTDPDDRAHRSYRIVRRPADGHAYATELADRYGLGYDAVAARLAR